MECIEYNLITRVLTFDREEFTQSTALEQERLSNRPSISLALLKRPNSGYKK